MDAATPNEARDRLPFGQHHAFIIGIDAYEKISPLQTAVADAVRLKEVLSEQQHFFVHPPLLNEGAKGGEIRTLLQHTLPDQVGKDDRVLFYFAGHGIAADGDDGPAGYLVPADADPTDVKTLLPMADLQEALEALSCRHLLLVLDCCFSGAFKWSSQYRAIGTMMPKRIYKERFDRFIQDPAWQVITSAAYDQKALDVVQGKATGARGTTTSTDHTPHSPFAQALFDALAGKADARTDSTGEGDGVITATEVYCYLRDQVEPQTIEEGQRLRQTPGFFPLRKHDKGEFIFLHPRHRRNLPPIPKHSPYKGLESFNEDDQLLFYGRDRVIKELRDKAQDKRLVVVSGASGTGKSSVIKAGLLPVLRKEGFRILPVIRPGAHPLAELEQALAEAHAAAPDGAAIQPPGAQKSILLIDQFEELITRCADENERKAFDARLRQLLDTDPSIHRIILTVRADFEPQLNDSALKEDWLKGRYVVPPFSLEELKEVIVMPTIQEVLIFDPPALVDEIIAEVVQSPGALPLLSYTLSELYEAYRSSGREDRALKKDDYDKLGGVMGALRTKADTLYKELEPPERETMRKIMLRMVSVEGDLASKRVPMDDLVYSDAEKPRVDTVVEQLVEARLIVKGQDYIEPAHDALVRAWKALHDWVFEVGKDKLILGNKLTDAATAWKIVKTKDKDQPTGILKRTGPILDWLDRFLLIFENFVTKIPAQLARQLRRVQNRQGQSKEKSRQFLWNTNPYLDVLNEQSKSNNNWFNKLEAEFVQESVLQRRQNTSWRRRIATGVILGLSGLTIAALIGQRSALIGQIQASQQTAEAKLLSNQELEALISSLQAAKTLQQSRLLQLFKPDMRLQKQVRFVLQKAVYQVTERNRIKIPNGTQRVVFSPNGQLLAIDQGDGTVSLWDRSGKPSPSFPSFKVGEQVSSISFGPDSKHLITVRSYKEDREGQEVEVVQWWNLSGQQVGKDLKQQSTGNEVMLGSNGRMMIFSENKLRDLESGTQLAEFPDNGAVYHKFSPDGKLTATGPAGDTVSIRNVNSKKEIVEIKDFPFNNWDIPVSVSFSPDSKVIAAAGSADDTIYLWDLKGNQLAKFEANQNGIQKYQL